LDTSNPSELAQRGHSKEKRGDLRIVGLALLSTLDFHIPLFHDVYPGNVHDSTEFRSVTDELVERYRILSDSCDHVTLVWDKGNNPPHNQAAIDASPYHCVGSIKYNQVSDLLKIPFDEFESLTGQCADHQVYRTQHELWGKKYTVLVVYNDAFYLGQMQDETMKLKKATQALRDLSQRLDQRRQGKITKGRAPDLAGVQNKVEQILGQSPLLNQVIRYEIALRDGVPDVRFFTDHSAFHHISSERFGKTVLFTSNDTWSNEDIIAAYRGEFEIEHAFSQMKDPQCVAWRPMFRWTDSKIRVHAFYCVLALTLTSLLRREVLQRAAADNIELEDTSATSIINRLENIKEVLHVYPADSKIEPHITLSRMTPPQRRLFDLLNLEKLAHSQVRHPDI
jgi:transposase